jgi:hypothetical protein
MPITLDESQWPLPVVRFERACSNAELEQYLTARSAWLRRGELHIPLLDTRTASQLPPPHQRQRYIDWIQRHRPLLVERSLGTAYLITSPAIRVLTSLMRHLSALTTAYIVSATPEEALGWSACRFQEAGLASLAQRVRRMKGLPSGSFPAVPGEPSPFIHGLPSTRPAGRLPLG